METTDDINFNLKLLRDVAWSLNFKTHFYPAFVFSMNGYDEVNIALVSHRWRLFRFSSEYDVAVTLRYKS